MMIDAGEGYGGDFTLEDETTGSVQFGSMTWVVFELTPVPAGGSLRTPTPVFVSD